MNTKKWVVNKINQTEAEILIYGYISLYDITSADFIMELNQLAAIYSDIKIRINSGGGSVFEGIAIFNAIKGMQKKGKKITTCVDGIAASMAAVLAVAGSPVQISKYGRIMTHRASGYAEGDADDMRRQAQLVEDAEGDLVKIFAEKIGMSENDVRGKLMQKGVDNWMNATQCINMKLADIVYDSVEVAVPENVTDEKQVLNIFENCLNKSSSNSGAFKTWDELVAKGMEAVEKLRESNPVQYSALYKNHFGRSPGIILPKNNQAASTCSYNSFDELKNAGMKEVENLRNNNPAQYKRLYKKQYGYEPKM